MIIKTVGLVGAGVIGASWTTLFLAKGLEVRVTDPAAGAEAALRKLVDESWPAMEKLGLAEGASRGRLFFSNDAKAALAGVDFVQENGPERPAVKRELLAMIDANVRDDVLIATSSSGILVSSFQDAARHPERVVLGHPFSPPHLIPLVEVLGGKLTSPEAVQRAMSFYASLGKKPIHVRREVKGHVANRLQAALFQEALSMVENGVATVADIDTAISHGPGLRWALLGPFLTFDIGGGAGGIGHLLEHVGPGMEVWWADFKPVHLSPALNAKTVEETNAFREPLAFDETVRQRDDILIQLLGLKRAANELP